MLNHGGKCMAAAGNCITSLSSSPAPPSRLPLDWGPEVNEFLEDQFL